MNLFNIWHFSHLYILEKLIIQSHKINCGLTNVVYIILYLKLSKERYICNTGRFIYVI